MTKKDLIKSTWYQVKHTKDYSKVIVTCENWYVKNNILYDWHGLKVEMFSEEYSHFPTHQAAEIFVKRRVRNEIKRFEDRLEFLRQQNEVLKKKT